MARKTEEANVVVTMNGEAAKKVLAEMTAKMDEYRAAAAKAYVDGDKAVGDAMTKKMKQMEKEIRISRNEMKDFSDVVKSLNSKSIRELTSASKQLQAQLKNLAPDTQEFIDKSKQLQQVNTRLDSLKRGFKGVKEEVKESSFSLKGLADGFNKYFGMLTAGIAAITGVSMAFRKTAEDAAALDDVYSDVMKTTGLMHDEVKALDEELMKLDTRTSREQLLLLARDAGKLGITGSENILGFVRAADKIQVALGEDLGEGAIRNLGKIADVFGYTKTKGIEDSLLSIGSAINAVGQASTANEAYLVDFTQRLAGVGAQTGISAANIIGFASGLDQSAMKVEMAATAFQTFLTKLYEDPAKFAQYAGMQVKEFTDLLKNDANTAVITILQNLKDQDGFAALVPIFKDMGVDGARATSVLAAMASNLTAITDAQSLANVEFEKATSLADEFATKNNNMQASLDKARKEFKNASIALGQSLNPILLKSTNATTYLIKALANYGKEIKTVLVVIAALTVALKAKVIWQKIVATWNATLKAGALALSAAQALLTGNIQAATAAWGAMSAVMKTTIFGLVAAAISGLIIALQHLNKETKELTELEKFEAEVKKDLNNATSSEAAQVKALRAILEDSNQSYENRKAALLELKKIVPDYHADLTEEGQLINNNVSALDDYIARMIQAAKAESLKGKLSEIDSKKQTELQYLEENAPQEFKDELGNWRYSYDEAMTEPRADGTYGTIHHMISKDCEAALDRLKEFEKEENLVLDMIRNSADGVVSNSQKTGGGGGGNIDKIVDQQVESLKDIRARVREQMDLIKDNEEWKGSFDYSGYGVDPNYDPKANEEFWNKIYAKRDSIVAALENDSYKKEYELELQWAEKLHQQGLLSEEEYQKRKLQLKLDYASKAAQELSKISEQASNLVNALRSAETAKAEAEYQAQLTAAGDNAEKREQIEAQYEAKKLDLQKKYANADMVIQIAQATASAAAACVEAWNEAKGNPYLAATLIGLITASTGAQIATIIAQRNAIMATTANGSNSSSNNAGYRILNEGYSEGGYTGMGGKYEPAGIVHRGEWVAPKWMVNENPVTFANLDQYRRRGSHGRSGSASRGFADGGYTSHGISEGINISSDNAVIERLAAILERIEANGISATVDYPQLKRFEQKDKAYRKEISR